MRCTGNDVRGTYSRKDAAYRANIIEEVLENVTVGIVKKNVSEDVDLDVGTQETEEIQSSVIEMQPSRNLLTMRDAEKNQEDEMQKEEKEEIEEIQEEDASPGPARKCSNKDDVPRKRQGNLRGLRDRKKDSVLSPARKGCTPGKIVRRRDLGFKLGKSSVANLRKMFEPYSLTKGLTEGPLQLLPAELYSGDTGLEDCASQWDAVG